MTESNDMRKLIESLEESYYREVWGDVHCGRCNVKIAETASSAPLPNLYCPACAEAEREESNESF